ncbi:hypothetical protein [Wolbachia endosymbiont of Ctenocephalides felis wCfeJ]|uniref:hypothetical protein n=1 Tax=Wolbachia endosymbiont of Ctenocephalides felis wCfeJ TaxID=2732594 RepID=UPI0014456E8C|nr:hypothetical protein [Wolbachia endosymbiont of Ctenocephalides felis wCfeJ]
MLDAGIQPYFHFYAKSKIRGFLCSSIQIDKALFSFLYRIENKRFLIFIEGCHSSA